jgi:protocatechuate 3,4-dioxygenase, beta subunit
MKHDHLRAADSLALAERTPDVVLGPFYPVDRTLLLSAYLTTNRETASIAAGPHIVIAGRLLDLHGRAVSGARIEVWQANAHGRYRHPCDHNCAPLDPAFDGFAGQLSDEAGAFVFRTVMPGAYPTPYGDTRAPHVHFQVTTEAVRLVTQMFFPNDELNDTDRFLRASARPDLLTARAAKGPSRPQRFEWDIVIQQP